MEQIEVLKLDPSDSYSKTYRMRQVAPGSKSVETFLPGDVVERAAKQRGLTTEQFVDRYAVEFLYDGIEGGFFRFVEKPRRSGDITTKRGGTIEST